MNVPHLVYFADPMCSWCWGFSPAIAAIREKFGERLPIRLVMGGLHVDVTEPLDEAGKKRTLEHWHHVHDASGQKFDFSFFDDKEFIYDTEPSCRAIVVARRSSRERALDMLSMLHKIFYVEGQDITQPEMLADVAATLHLDRASFLEELRSTEARQETVQDFLLSQQAGVTGFPTLIAGTGRTREYSLLTRGFQPPDRILALIDQWLPTALPAVEDLPRV